MLREVTCFSRMDPGVTSTNVPALDAAVYMPYTLPVSQGVADLSTIHPPPFCTPQKQNQNPQYENSHAPSVYLLLYLQHLYCLTQQFKSQPTHLPLVPPAPAQRSTSQGPGWHTCGTISTSGTSCNEVVLSAVHAAVHDIRVLQYTTTMTLGSSQQVVGTAMLIVMCREG